MKRALLAATLLLPIEAQADPTKEWISVITPDGEVFQHFAGG